MVETKKIKPVPLIKEIKPDFDCPVFRIHFPRQAGEALDNGVL